MFSLCSKDSQRSIRDFVCMANTELLQDIRESPVENYIIVGITAQVKRGK